MSSTTIPEKFTDHLIAEIPGLSTFSGEHQARMSHRAWASMGQQFQHKGDPAAFHYSCRQKERDFGRGGFERINDACEIFDVSDNWSIEHSQTKRHWLTGRIKGAINCYLERPGQETPLITDSGRYISTPKPAIYGRDSNGRPCKAQFQIPYGIPINVENINAVLSFFQQWLNHFLYGNPAPDVKPPLDTANPVEWLERRITALMKILALQANTVLELGHIPMRYVETPAGRLQGQSFHLQNEPREVRNAALASDWDYDIDNCHFSIVAQLSREHGQPVHIIESYMANKDEYRILVAEQAGITKSQSKTVLLALLYGAKSSASPYTAIAQEIGCRAAQRLFEASAFMEMDQAVQVARKAILADQKPYRGCYWNSLGKGIAATGSDRRVLAHLMQGIEAQMLGVVGKRYGDDLLLLMHDGWVARTPLPVQQLEDAIAEETGFTVSLSERYLRPHVENISDQKDLFT
jgi:hypothetical protein